MAHRATSSNCMRFSIQCFVSIKYKTAHNQYRIVVDFSTRFSYSEFSVFIFDSIALFVCSFYLIPKLSACYRALFRFISPHFIKTNQQNKEIIFNFDKDFFNVFFIFVRYNFFQTHILVEASSQ